MLLWGRAQGLVLLGGLGLLSVVVMAAQFRTEPAPTATKVATATAGAGPSPAAGPSGPAEAIRWQGQELLIDLDDVPLPQAIALLASATRSTVTGVQGLQKPATVTLHWRSTDLGAAWQQLLQGHAMFSMACSASNCQVWIAGAATAPAAAATPGSERKQPTPEDRAAEELEQSQPGGSC